MIRPRGNNDAEAFADALEGRGPRNSDVQQLVRFAESLCEAAVDPSPAFLQSLRAELMADASSVLAVAPTRVRTVSTQQGTRPVRKRLAAATAGLLATAGMVGIASSSAQALPGEMLYPVKRGVESVQLTLHRSEAGRGSFQLSQATERLAEAGSLAKQGDVRTDDLVIKSLTEFSDTASSGSEALFSDYSNGGNNASIDKVSSFATSSSAMLSDLSSHLSPDALDVFKMAASTVTDLVSQSNALCAACSSATLTSLAGHIASLTSLAGQAKITTSKPASSTESSVKNGVASVLPKPSSSTAAGSITSLPPVVTSPASPTPESISGVTDPIVGALLGDGDQVGLVPGILGGLTGH